MTVHVRLFALLRDLAQTTQTSLDLSDGATVADAVTAVAARYPAVSPALARTAYAVNMTKVDANAVLHDGDELALLPPVSGG
ncbi:MAG TPA: MoaD/ThiS family protein [Tepidisphaeraceae bacterium]|nr:MoaD/ThiS family protein [Tepidisphaeraceae bacterium]